MRRVAEVSVQRAHHLARRLADIEGFALADPARSFLWEFALRVPGGTAEFVAAMRGEGILAGLALERVDPRRHDQILVCCTETTAPGSIDRYVDAASRYAAPLRVSA